MDFSIVTRDVENIMRARAKVKAVARQRAIIAAREQEGRTMVATIDLNRAQSYIQANTCQCDHCTGAGVDDTPPSAYDDDQSLDDYYNELAEDLIDKINARLDATNPDPRDSLLAPMSEQLAAFQERLAEYKRVFEGLNTYAKPAVERLNEYADILDNLKALRENTRNDAPSPMMVGDPDATDYVTSTINEDTSYDDEPSFAKRYIAPMLEDRADQYHSSAGAAWELSGDIMGRLFRNEPRLLDTNYTYAWSMILCKLLRALQSPTYRDHWADIIGYAQLVLEDIDTANGRG